MIKKSNLPSDIHSVSLIYFNSHLVNRREYAVHTTHPNSLGRAIPSSYCLSKWWDTFRETERDFDKFCQRASNTTRARRSGWLPELKIPSEIRWMSAITPLKVMNSRPDGNQFGPNGLNFSITCSLDAFHDPVLILRESIHIFHEMIMHRLLHTFYATTSKPFIHLSIININKTWWWGLDTKKIAIIEIKVNFFHIFFIYIHSSH